MKNVKLKPFIKWAGGKTQLLNDIKLKYPKELGYSINRYCEPFVGGGAILFDLLSHYSFSEIIINDINAELINTYKQIRDNINILISYLKIIQNEFLSLSIEEKKLYYYDKRDRFNFLKINGEENINIEKAALFIFLNKTCFNGLFRVNSYGMFNVPMGSYSNPTICDEENLLAVNKALNKTIILCGDYIKCLSYLDSNTFVYIDPPYRPISMTSFTSYNENIFGDNEQIKLEEFIKEITNKGAKVILSNSDPKNYNEDDQFFDILYRNYNIERINAKRMINCNGEKRGEISELIITNYEV